MSSFLFFAQYNDSEVYSRCCVYQQFSLFRAMEVHGSECTTVCAISNSWIFGGLQFWAVMNETTVHLLIHVFLWTCTQKGKLQGMGWIHIYLQGKVPNGVPKCLCCCESPSAVHESASCSHAHLQWSRLKSNVTHSSGCAVIPRCSLTLISPVIDDAKKLFISLLAIRASSFVKCLLKSSVHFLQSSFACIEL